MFGCRSPSWPNPIGFFAVELLRCEGNRLTVRGLDAVDGSPALHVKPYGPRIDAVPDTDIGWFKEGAGVEPRPVRKTRGEAKPSCP